MTINRVSVDSAGNQGNKGSRDPSISSDGRFVAFVSLSSNLVPGDSELPNANRSTDKHMGFQFQREPPQNS
jgi:hypothetical protein